MDEAHSVVLDNGAYTVKVGLSSYEDPLIVPNSVMKARSERRRAFIGNQIDECRDASGLFYILCFQKGYLVNWDVQKTLWDHIFSSDCANINPAELNLIITEPQFNFASIQEAMVEIFFEEYHCAGIHKTTTADLATYNYAVESDINPYKHNCIVIDVGYSFTHVVPFLKGKRVLKAIRRIEVGGKMLTNHLKEIISYRHLNMMDESYVVNQIKEDVCFVSQDFVDDMRVHQLAKKRDAMTVEYVLPDFTSVRRGYVRTDHSGDLEQQTLKVCNERFTVPELLFNPSDIGINQMGVADAVIDALSDCPANVHCELLRNIIVIGGSAQFGGFVPRLKAEIRAMAPDDVDVSLIFPEDPASYGWYGGKELACSDNFADILLMREEYDERGYSAVSWK